MQFTHEIQRVFLGTLIAFGFVGLGAMYWAITGPDTILLREDNPRLIEDIADIERGSIYDRDEQLLVETHDVEGTNTRDYLHESTYSALGYYSLRYGEGGVESAFNDTLSGTTSIDSFENYFEQNILNMPLEGSDIRLTLDLDLQNALVDSIGEGEGAGVIMNGQTGNILALASLPTYDPNTLDANWDDLIETEGNPFFNRALQGQYQPGGVMYTLWMAQALLTRYDTSQLIANGADTVSLGDDTSISCVLDAQESNLSLLKAYTYACPVPFAVYSRTTSERTYDDLVEAFALNNPITLDGFPVPEPISATSGTSAEIDPAVLNLRNTLGQGSITVSPLHVAGIMSAIVHNGNAPQPTILQAIQSPDSDTWQPQPNTTQAGIPMMTIATARQLQTTLRTVWSTIQSDTYPTTISVGATVATSQSGEDTQQWLIGFVRDEQGGRVAFVLLLENTTDIQTLISVGQNLIQAIIEEAIAT